MRGLLVKLAVACAVCFFGGGVARAQCEGHFASRPEQEIPGVGGEVNSAVEWDPDGDGPQGSLLVVGGVFPSAGRSIAQNIATWDGTEWQPLGGGIPGGVHSIAVAGGRLFALGTGYNAASNVLRRWNGQTWVLQMTNVSRERVAVLGDEIVVIAGLQVYAHNGIASRALGSAFARGPDFIAVGNGVLYAVDTSYKTVWRWDGSAWQVVPLPGTATILMADGTSAGLVLSGGFLNQSVWSSNFLRLEATGWRPLGYLSLALPVVSLSEVDGELYCFGSGGMVHWNGSSWVAPAFSTPTNLRKVQRFRGELIGLGNLAVTGPSAIGPVAIYDAGAWHTVGSGIGRDTLGFAVRAVASVGPDVFIGGTFHQDFPVPLEGVARRNGEHWDTLGTGLSPHAEVYALAADGGSVIVGGQFTSAGGVATQNIGTWDGTSWSTFGPGLGDSIRGVHAVTRWNGHIFSGGKFTTSGVRSVRCVAEWNGVEWNELGSGLNERVLALATFGGRLIAAGAFTATNDGAPLQHVGAWDGIAWHEMGAGLNGTVNALFVFENELYAGGTFTGTGGETPRAIARWNGTAWQRVGELTPADSTSVSVTSLGTFQGQLLATGFNYSIESTYQKFVRRWNGADWRNLMAPSATVLSTAEHDGRLEVVGTFSTIGGVAGSGLGTYERGSPISVSPTVAVQPTQAGDPAQVSATVTASTEFTYRWRRNGVPLTSLIYVSATGGPPVAREFVNQYPSFRWPQFAGTYDLEVTDGCGPFVNESVFLGYANGCGPADIGGTGGLPGPDNRTDNNDFIVFIDWYFAGDMRADVGNSSDTGGSDGLLNSDDFVEFIDLFFQGCA